MSDQELLQRVRRRLAQDAAPVTGAAVVGAVRALPGKAPLGATALLDLADRVYDQLLGAGPLAALVADPGTTDIVVNGPDQVWVDRGDGMVRVEAGFPDADALRRFAQRLAAACGRRLDDSSPYVDARLPDGTRLHAVLPPVAVDGPYLSLRTFRRQAYTLDDLVAAGTLTRAAAQLLDGIVRSGLAYLVSGGTGSGKTTLLTTLLAVVPARQRIVIVEDAAELRPEHPHVVCLQARPANVEGAGAVTLRDLVRQALRMRPDRLVVGECRGAEVVDLLAALNTGHEGGAATLHSNTAGDVPARLEALGLIGGLSREALHAQLAAGLQVVLHLGRARPVRMLEEVCLLLPAGPSRLVRAITAWSRDGGPGPAAAALGQLLARRGVVPPPMLGGLS